MTVSAFAGGEGLDAALRAYGPAAIADAVERLMAMAGALDRAAADGLWHGLLIQPTSSSRRPTPRSPGSASRRRSRRPT